MWKRLIRNAKNIPYFGRVIENVSSAFLSSSFVNTSLVGRVMNENVSSALLSSSYFHTSSLFGRMMIENVPFALLSNSYFDVNAHASFFLFYVTVYKCLD